MLHDKVNVNKHNNNIEEEIRTNKVTINEITINKTTINKTTIYEITIDKTTIKKATINKITVSKVATVNEYSIYKATKTNKAKNDTDIYDESTKKKENISIQKINQLDTLNLTLARLLLKVKTKNSCIFIGQNIILHLFRFFYLLC